MLTEDQEMGIIDSILKKYNIKPVELVIAQLAIKGAGFGRNEHTANVLMALIDLINCPITSEFDDEMKH